MPAIASPPARRHGRGPARAAAALAASLGTLAFAAAALAATAVEMGDAHSFSIVANAVTSTGATAMSDDLGSTTPVGGAPLPMVLGQTYTGDAAAAAARSSMSIAYANAQLLQSTGVIPPDLAGASFGPGVYTANGPSASRPAASPR